MDNNTTNNKKQVTRKHLLRGVLFGLLFPLLAWVIELSNKGLSFGFAGLNYIHSHNLVLYIVDTAPFIIVAIIWLVLKSTTKLKENLLGALEKQKKILEKNSEFAKKIGQGDLKADIEVSPDDLLGQSLLVMRKNLIETNLRETEQSWIAKGKELVGDKLRLHNKIEDLSYETIVTLVNYINGIQGAFYIYDEQEKLLKNIATYAYNRRKYENKTFKLGQGLIGAAAFEKDIIYRKEIPENYTTITSGILGNKKPRTLLITPLLGDKKLQGVIEIASLDDELPEKTINLFREISNIVGQTVFNLKVNEQTENLLLESRNMTHKLKKNEEELRHNAEQMKQTQTEIEETNRKLAAQIIEVERSQKRLYALLENASEVISIYDKSGIITYESPSIKTILGLKDEELVGRDGFSVFDNESNLKFREAFDQLLEEPNEPVSFETLFKKEDGTEMWLETTGRNLLKNPAINGIIFNTRNVTVRKVAEKAQRMSGRMQALSENSIDMIVRVNNKGKFVYANPIAEQYISVGKRNLIGNTIGNTSLPMEIKNVFQNALEKIQKQNIKFESETMFPMSDGDGERIVEFNAIPEFNELNELETILFVAHDITEQKLTQLEIEKKNKSITESINYARRIQTALLPTENKIRDYLPNSFMFYRPRDVVSGDIPWIFPIDNIVYIAAIDCTGHGVPGALLSFIGYFLLNNIITKSPKELDAGKILDELHQSVRKTLKQDTPDAEARDGMDIALCKIDLEKNKMDFAGAHRPLYYLKNDGTFMQYKGSLKAIGGIPMKNRTEKDFINHSIEYQKNDKIFFFSDGLADQIGGEKGRKLKNTKIREIIMENKDMKIFNFSNVIESEFISWKGNYKQIDDIILLGVEL